MSPISCSGAIMYAEEAAHIEELLRSPEVARDLK